MKTLLLLSSFSIILILSTARTGIAQGGLDITITQNPQEISNGVWRQDDVYVLGDNKLGNAFDLQITNNDLNPSPYEVSFMWDPREFGVVPDPAPEGWQWVHEEREAKVGVTNLSWDPRAYIMGMTPQTQPDQVTLTVIIKWEDQEVVKTATWVKQPSEESNEGPEID